MATVRKRRKRRKVDIGQADYVLGEHRVVMVEGRSVGVFNVDGDYFALHNRCPHMGGNLCEGPVTGTAVYTDGTQFIYGMEGEIVRCGWHGWEFEIKTGNSLVDEKMKARRFEVSVENGRLFLHM